jgi:diacylglycerol kinase family enzyme
MSEDISPTRDSAISISDDNMKYGSLLAHLAPDVAVHVLVSVLSGSHFAHDFFNTKIKPDLDAIHPSYTVTLTKSTKTVIEYTKTTIYPSALTGQPQTIILLSGDGGISDIVDTLHSCIASDDPTALKAYTPPTIALLPLGTGNALAHSTGLGDPEVALTRLFTGTPHPLPTFTVSFSTGAQLISDEGRARTPISANMHGCVVFSWGLHASLVHMSDTAAYRQHGLERFKMAAGELMKVPHGYRGRVSLLKGTAVGEESWIPLQHAGKDENTHSYILATLVSRLEATFVISPETEPLSGNLRVVALPEMTAQELGRILGLAYQGGKHVGEEGVTYEEIDGVRIEFEEDDGRWRVFCVDGKIVEVAENGWVEVRRQGEEERVVELVC